jgi:antitoxin ParD1/3/4
MKSHSTLHCGKGGGVIRTTQQFSITPPLDIAEVVEDKIRSGGYASVSEVVGDGVRALIERDVAPDQWLREEVVAGHQEYLADPSKGIPAGEVAGRIKARRAAQKAKWPLCGSFSRQWPNAISTNCTSISPRIQARNARTAISHG